MSTLSIATIKQHLIYNPTTGEFFRVAGFATKGADACRITPVISPSGTPTVGFHTHKMSATRVAWAYVHGEWPPKRLKLRDGDVTNLCIDNMYVPLGRQKVDRVAKHATDLQAALDYTATFTTPPVERPALTPQQQLEEDESTADILDGWNDTSLPTFTPEEQSFATSEDQEAASLAEQQQAIAEAQPDRTPLEEPGEAESIFSEENDVEIDDATQKVLDEWG